MNALATLRKNVRYLRLARGESQEAAAARADLMAKYFQDIEAGRRKGLRLATVERIAKALNVEVWEIFQPGRFPKPERLRGKTGARIKR